VSEKKKEEKMAYAQMKEADLRNLLAERDKELADVRKKNAENERNVPQVICMAPAIPLPVQWNLKAGTVKL
jgi:hypothetical protein